MTLEHTADASQSKNASGAADRVLRVMEALGSAKEPLTLTRVASVTGIPLATSASILYALEDHGFAQRAVSGRSHYWSLTLALYSLASKQVQSLNYGDLARAEMQRLAETLGLPVHIGVLSDTLLVYVAKEASQSFIQFDTYPGKSVPFNLTALGRAIAAHVPADRIDYLAEHLARGTGPNADHEDFAGSFRQQMEFVRANGYAYEDQEEVPGVSCVAVPFFDSRDVVAGAVGVTGMSDTVTGPFLQEIVDETKAAAQVISRRLGRR